MSRSIDQIILLELSKMLMPLSQLRSGIAITNFVNDLGWHFDGTFDDDLDLTALVESIDILANTVVALALAESDEEKQEILLDLAYQVLPIIIQLRDDIPKLKLALENMPNVIGKIDDIAVDMLRRLFDWLLYRYLESNHPKGFYVFHFIGIAERVQDGYGFAIRTINWDYFGLLFSDPLQLAEKVYQWNTDFNGNEFLIRSEKIIRAYSLPGGFYRQTDIIRNALEKTGDDNRELRIPVFQAGRWPHSYVELDVNLTETGAVPVSTTSPAKNAGLVAYPFASASLDFAQGVGAGWKIYLRGNADLAAGLGVELRAPHNLAVSTNLFGGGPLGVSNVRVEAGIKNSAGEDALRYIFGSADGSHLGFKEIGLGSVIALSTGKEDEFGIEFEIIELTLAISSDNADGFLKEILSGISINSVCDLVLGYSNLDGVYFRGSGALEIVIPIHKFIGPIWIDSILIGAAVDRNFQITLAASFGIELGPISASVQEIGLNIPITFPIDGDGNLGPINVNKPAFKPPIGAGLSLSSGIVGGGFLEFDKDNERYAGILALQFGEIGLVAIGLITTRMPDGSKGFSMLVNIGVTFDPAIQLSMGFALAGVGGLIGINRSMDIDVLRNGIKNRTLDSILFPDPDTVIANANKIISDLRSVFPPTKDQFVVGPMVKIIYGTPALITADIGIFIQFPDPVRVVLLGQVEMALPEAKQPIVSIRLDVLGVLDFEKEELTFQASLYDSSILVFALVGDAAFLLSWGNDPQFAMSLGGFHPKFTPPPPPILFGDLKRLSLSLSSGSSFQLSCRAYQALTPNSLQFGARVDLYAKEGGAVCTGFIGFDALIYFSPFSFEVWIGGGVVVKYEGHTLADVDISLMLSGPTPWDARGKARIKILFVKVKVGFHVTWGSRDQKTLPAIDPWLPMQQALSDPGNWSSVLPRGTTIVESLRDMDEEVAKPFVVHPSGSLEIRQKVAPLNIKISKVGNAPVKDHDAFTIDSLIVDTETINVESVDELFARGQVQNLNAQQKLSVPAFEKYQGGVKSQASTAIKVEGIDDAGLVEGTRVVEEKLVGYESILLNDNRISEVQDEPGTLQWSEAKHIAKVKYVRQAMRRAGTRKKFGSLKIKEKVSVKEELYCIADASTLTRAVLDVGLTQDNYELTRIVAEQFLEEHLQRTPKDKHKLIVVPEYELEEVA